MIQEFKEFVTRGNLADLAVAFIMGVVFAGIVSSFVGDIVMPLIAIPFGEPDFTTLIWEVNGSIIAWGSFLTAVVVFLSTALGVFLLIVKPHQAYMARMADDDPTDEERGPTEIELLAEIRDSLARR